MRQYLTLIGYSSALPEMAEAEELHPIYDLSHNNQMTSDTVSGFGISYMIICE